ncbi:threonine/serine ThrE exporter family protein [Mycolicibacterium thermoresistibile]
MTRTPLVARSWVRLGRAWAALQKDVPAALAAPDSYDDADVAAMLRQIGIALVEVQQPTQLVRDRLLRIADRYTTKEVRVVVLPTVLLIQIGTDGYEVESSTRGTTQLDLAGRVDAIAELAGAGAITPRDAIAALADARSMKHRFGIPRTVLGYVLTTLGFGVLINPTWASLPWYLLLGALVGFIVTIGASLPALTPIAPAVAAMVVTALSAGFIAEAANDNLLRVISPPLVAILPGLALTIGAMELASSAVIAGASRLVYGVTQLMLIVFGVTLGLTLTTHRSAQQMAPVMGEWTFYPAILIVGIGIYLYLSGPPGSLLWLTAAVGVALVGQQVGELFTSAAHAGALGALLTVPFAVAAARIKTAPPAIVMVLAAFWSLVPGALSFESLGEVATDDALDVGALGSAVAAIFSIALGTLVGWSLYTSVGARLRGVSAGSVGTSS